MKEEKMILIVNKKDFLNHIKKVCLPNIRRSCKICTVCPFKKDVLKIIKE